MTNDLDGSWEMLIASIEDNREGVDTRLGCGLADLRRHGILSCDEEGDRMDCKICAGYRLK